MDIIREAMKKETWHRKFFNSLEKSPPETIGELMQRAEKYIRLHDTSRIKREQNPHFAKKGQLRRKRERKVIRGQRERIGRKMGVEIGLTKETDINIANIIQNMPEKVSHPLTPLGLRY